MTGRGWCHRVHSSCLSLPKGRRRGSPWEPCEPAPVADDWLKPEPQIDSCNDGSRELIPVFHNPHRKCLPSPEAVARNLEYFEGVFS